MFRYFLLCQLEHTFQETELLEDSAVYPYAHFFCIEWKNQFHETEYALSSVVKKLEKQYQIHVYVICYDEKEQRTEASACLAICDAMNYINLNDPSRVLRYSEMVFQPGEKIDSMPLAGSFFQYIEKQDRENFEKIVDKVFEEMYHKQPTTAYEAKINLSVFVHEVIKKINSKRTLPQKKILERMSEIYSERYFFTKEYSRNWLLHFTEELWGLMTENTVVYPEKFRMILSYIHSHYNQKITLQMISDEFYFTASTISRMFMKYAGVNFVDYVNMIRMEKARDLMENSTKTISEIAEITGFESLSYFSKMFKKKYGISPLEYRKK